MSSPLILPPLWVRRLASRTRRAVRPERDHGLADSPNEIAGHVLWPAILVGDRRFITCECGWTRELFTADVPSHCLRALTWLDLQRVTRRIWAELEAIDHVSRREGEELRGLLGGCVSHE